MVVWPGVQGLVVARHQAPIYSSIETTRATSTHMTMVRSIQLPNDGEPGSAFLSGSTAKSMAAYQVVSTPQRLHAGDGVP